MSQMKKIMMILQLMLIACQAYAVDLYVIGANVNGKNWLLEDPDAKMQLVSPGVYEWSGETLGSGFKINDGTWTNPYYEIGSSGVPLTLGTPYYCNIGGGGNIAINNVSVVKNPHLTLDLNVGTILLEGEKAEDPYETYYIVGTFNDWLIDSPESLMEKEGSRYVKRGLIIPEEKKETGRFKIAAPSWTNSWGYGSDSGFDCITPENTIAQLTSEDYGINYDMYYTISGTYDVWWDPTTRQVAFTESGDNEDPFAFDYGDLYIIGDNVNGNHWLLADDSAKFTSIEKGVYEWAGSYLGNGFKINDGTWDSRYLNGTILNIGSNGDGLVLDEPYYFHGGSSSENIGFATVTEVFNPIVSLDMNARTIIVSADGHALTLRLPDEAADGRYKNCVIELVDNTTDIKQRHIITDRLSYTFQGVGSKNEYSLRMFTPSNVEIAALEGIKMPKADMEISFAEIKTLYPVGIEIMTPDGATIADGLTVEWFISNAGGEYSYLRQGMDAGTWPAGTSLLCKVTLGEGLSTLYFNPSDTLLTVSGEGDFIKLPLTPLTKIRLTGQVVDESGSPMEGVTVTASQLLNGKYPYSAVGLTDRSGNWMVEILEGAKPDIVFSAKDYVNQRKTLEALGSDSEEVSLGKIVLPAITGAKISLAVSYRAAGSEDISSFFTDYQNLALEVFNLTQGRTHDNISVQYPLLAVLDEEIQPGDELRLTLRSLTGLFAPVERTVTLDADRKGSVEAVIVGKGGIKAGFSMTDNPEVTASLYNAGGELVEKRIYTDASVVFTGLEAGNYTLLSMGRSDMIDAPLRLSLLSEIGLKEGKDYVTDSVEVTDGEMTLISNPEIPAFDDSPYYFTSDNSGVSANKSSITTGNYLTLRADVDFRGAYADKVGNVSLIFDFPQGSDFVNQSVISGSAPISYTLEENRLTIPLGNDWKKQIRFCVIPTVAGRFTATANLRFDYDGEEKMQPLGYASSNVKEMEITVPKVIQNPKFSVTGVTVANSQVSVFDDGVLIATGKADSNGSWKVECELPQAYNLSVHPIHAEVLTPEGTTLMSEKQSMTYDMNAIRVSKVTMYHWNPEWGKTYVAEFDFLNPSTTPTQWTLYYPKKQFTYTIEFTDNDPEKVSDVILYVHTADGKYVPVAASYDADKGCWYATIDMGSEANAYYPVNCSIDFDYYSEAEIDGERLDEMKNEVQTAIDEVNDSLKEAEELLETMDEMMAQEKVDREEFEAMVDKIYLSIKVNRPSEEIDPNIKKRLDNASDDNERARIIDEERKKFHEEPSAEYKALENSLNSSINVSLPQSSINGVPTPPVKVNTGPITDGKFPGKECEPHESDEPSDMIICGGISINVGAIQDYNVRSDEDYRRWAQEVRSKMVGYSNIIESSGGLMAAIDDYTIAKELFRAESQLAFDRQLLRLKFSYENGTHFINPNDYVKDLEYIKEGKEAVRSARQTQSIVKGVSKKAAKFGTAAGVVGLAMDLLDYNNVAKDWDDLISKIESNCNKEETKNELKEEAEGYKEWIKKRYIGKGITDLGCTGVSALGLAGAGVSGGLSLALNAVSFIATVSTVVWEHNFTETNNKHRKTIIAKLNNKPGVCEPLPEPYPGLSNNGEWGNDHYGYGNDWSDSSQTGYLCGGAYHSGSSDNNVANDPSGYVYEAVRDNRVEGVQASIYYKETKEDMYGDTYEEVMLWNAEEYAQRNPLFTDERGMYRWDVPQGLWQVKFEKDGYVTAYSEWLPVPPPQLDVNIAISQAKQPEVVEARAYEEGVEVRFDKFMKPLTLTKENIHVSVDGTTLPGSIMLLDEGSDSEITGEGVKYASRVRFVPETPLGLTTGEVRLTISPNVLSYCDVPMGEVFTQILDVEKEVQIISAEPTRVLYGDEKEITIFALPFDAAAGRTLNVSSASDVILGVEEGDLKLDADGKAIVKIKGLLPGSTRLYFSIPDVTVTGESDVEVVTEIIEAEAPKSSRASGTEVYRGTKVELTTTTKDAVIYYTLDGSCPCDADGTRRKYSVPIVINDDTRILAMTMVGNNSEDVSDVVSFNYTIKRNAMDYTLPQGWSWISHAFENPLPVDTLLKSEGIKRILSQRGEEADAMMAAEGYKVETAADVAVERLSDVAWNPSTPISLRSGMNWIGYPLSQAMTPDEAFSSMDPEAGDVLIGQRGFAEYDGEKWVGILDLMLPGEGYLYKSKSEKTLIYNRSIVSKARARKSRRAAAAGSPVNIHAHRDVMPLVAVITDNGEALDCSRYELAAYMGDECRGTATQVDGVFMMNIHGAPEEEISLVVTDMSDFSQTEAGSLSLHEDVVGSLEVPFEIDLSDAPNGITAPKGESSISVEIIDRSIVIGGVESEEIEMVKVLDMEGRVLVSVTNPDSVRIDLPAMNEGVYVVIVNARGEVICRKAMLR